MWYAHLPRVSSFLFSTHLEFSTSLLVLYHPHRNHVSHVDVIRFRMLEQLAGRFAERKRMQDGQLATKSSGMFTRFG